MPAISFSGEPRRGPFWRLILDGEKTMTTRKVRKRGGPRVGQTAYLYWKQRVAKTDKPIHHIGDSTIISVKRYPNMRRLLLALGVKGSLEYIKAEGFDNLGELVEWWTGVESPTYGITEEGILLGYEVMNLLEQSGPVEVIEWAYPLMEEAEP